MFRIAFIAKIEIGTMPWMAPNATLAGMPMPKTSRMIGYRVTFGIEYSATRIGSATSPASRLAPSETPTRSPTAVAMTNAWAKARRVSQTWGRNRGLPNIWTRVSKVRSGDRSATSPTAR